MHPPQHIVDELQRIDPALRLGWSDDKFWLIEVLDGRRPCPPTADPWDQRGPVYGKAADLLTEQVVALGYFTPQEIFGGEILKIARDRVTPFTEVMEISLKEYASEMDDTMDDLVGQAGEELEWRANRTDAASPAPIPKKHLTKDEKEILSGDHWTQRPLSEDILQEVPK